MECVDSLLIMEGGDDDDDDDDDDYDDGENNENNENNASGNHNECSEQSAGSGGPPNPHTEPAPDWCKCRKCQPMAQDIENKCCGKKNYITLRRRFEKLCLDAEALELSIK